MHGVQRVVCYKLMHNLTILTRTSHLLIYTDCFQYFSNLIMAYKFNNMRFLPIKIPYDFIQVLNSTRKFYTKN
jgi:hypothetical protein